MSEVDVFSPSTVVGLGEILWDLLPDGKQFGGAPANFVFHTKLLGENSFIVSAVGDDILGHELLDHLNNLGLSCQYVALDKYHPTGTVTVKVDKEGTPNFIIHEKVAWDNIPLSEGILELAKRTDAVCFGTLAQRSIVSRETIRAFLKSMPPESLRIFDVNLRPPFVTKQVILDMLQLADVLKLNNEELPIISEMCSITGNETNILRQFLERYDLKLIALTKGKNGSRLLTPEYDSNKPAKMIKVVDTVGAGDAFTAALVSGLLRNFPLEKIHEQAVNLAGYVCTQKGATPELSDEFKKKILTP